MSDKLETLLNSDAAITIEDHETITNIVRDFLLLPFRTISNPLPNRNYQTIIDNIMMSYPVDEDELHTSSLADIISYLLTSREPDNGLHVSMFTGMDFRRFFLNVNSHLKNGNLCISQFYSCNFIEFMKIVFANISDEKLSKKTREKYNAMCEFLASANGELINKDTSIFDVISYLLAHVTKYWIPFLNAAETLDYQQGIINAYTCLIYMGDFLINGFARLPQQNGMALNGCYKLNSLFLNCIPDLPKDNANMAETSSAPGPLSPKFDRHYRELGDETFRNGMELSQILFFIHSIIPKNSIVRIVLNTLNDTEEICFPKYEEDCPTADEFTRSHGYMAMRRLLNPYADNLFTNVKIDWSTVTDTNNVKITITV